MNKKMNGGISTMRGITFKKSFDPHKLRLHLTPKAFFFDAFQKLPS